ncbi:MAG: hypothetical protein ABUS79_27025 [Pseudomonadota bacterium]
MRAPFSTTMLSGLVSAVALFGVASCSTTVASVPSQPAYDSDVQPILMAHCARCHGAGDALNVATQPTGPDAAVLPSIEKEVAVFRGLYCYLDRFPADNGACTPGDGGGATNNCKRGAAYWAKVGLLKTTIHATSGINQMPPPPAPALDDWEKKVIDNWVANPICSNSTDPDPTICPPGS